MTEQVNGVNVQELLKLKGIKNNNSLITKICKLDKDNNNMLIGDELNGLKNLLKGKVLGEAMALSKPVEGYAIEKHEDETVVAEEKAAEPKAELPEAAKNAFEETNAQEIKGVTENEANLILDASRNSETAREFGQALAQLYSEGKITQETMIRANQLGAQGIIEEANTVIGRARQQRRLGDYITNYTTTRGVAVDDITEEELGRDKVKRKDVRGVTFEHLKDENGKLNRKYKKVSRIGDIKTQDQVIANKKSVEFHEEQTAEQAEKRVKDKKHVDIESLMEKGLVKRNADGTYDFTELSNKIKEAVGEGDYELSKDHKDRTSIREIDQVRTYVSMALDLPAGQDLTDNEVKMLVRACGYNVEHKDWAKIFLATIGGAVAGAALTGGAAGAAAYTNPDQSFIREGDVTNHKLELNLEGLVGEINPSQLAEGTLIEETATGIRILIDQMIKQPDEFYKISKYVVPTALKSSLPGAIAGALVGFLSTLPDTPEKPVCTVEISENQVKTYADYCKFVDHNNIKDLKKYAPVMKMLALLYTNEDGTMNVAEYKKMLRRYSGEGGTPLNRKELMGMLADLQAGKIVPPAKPAKTEDVTSTGEQEEQEEEQAPSCSVRVDEQWQEGKPCYNHHTIKKGDTWSTLIHTYYQEVLDSGKSYREVLNALRQELGAKATDTDLPWLQGENERYLELPCELLGVQCQQKGNLDDNRTKYNATEFTRTVQRSTGKEVQVKRSLVGYIATDGCDSTQAWGNTKEEAVAELKKRTHKTYSNESEYTK